MKLNKALVEDEDYIVVNNSPPLVIDGQWRRSGIAVEVFTTDYPDDLRFMCRKCNRFLARSVGAVNAHQRIHNADDRAERLAAFALLPEKVQRALLARVKGGR